MDPYLFILATSLTILARYLPLTCVYSVCIYLTISGGIACVGMC